MVLFYIFFPLFPFFSILFGCMTSKCYFCLMYHVLCVCYHGVRVWMCVFARLSSTPVQVTSCMVCVGVCEFMCVHTCTYFSVSVLFSLRCWHTVKINWQKMESVLDSTIFIFNFCFFTFGKRLGLWDSIAASSGAFIPPSNRTVKFFLKQPFISNWKSSFSLVSHYCSIFPNNLKERHTATLCENSGPWAAARL